MSRREAFKRAARFLEACTEPVTPTEYSFDSYEVPTIGRFEALERRLSHQFAGDNRARPRFPNQIAVHPSRVTEALDFLDEIDPQPTNEWGMAPIWFWVFSEFRIIDPVTGQPLPGQDPGRFAGVEYEARVPLGSSNLRLILNTHAALGLELCLPDADEKLLDRIVPWLQSHLPMKLSPHHWRTWTPTKSGSLKARRMVAPRDIARR